MTGKNDTTKSKPNTVKSAGEAVVGQLITEYTRPIVEKIPMSALQMLKSVGAEKVLPVVAVILSTFFSKEKFPMFGDKFGDFIAEFTAELRRAINDKAGDGEEISTADKKEKSISESGVKNFNRVLLNEKLLDEGKLVNLLAAFAELFKDAAGADRTEKEKKQILALLNQMEAKDLIVFLSAAPEVRELYLGAFVKKAKEKSFTEALAEFKKDLKEFKQKAAVVKDEIIDPIFKKLDEITGAKADGTMGAEMKKIDDGVGQLCNFLKSFGT
ncbi:MAG: hypothetical protein WC422_04965 [Candidatus Paceibacterota bacterium]|jgi:Sec-independent protein translocase protein TatA